MASDPSQYEMQITIEPSDIDALGHVNNVTYVRWIQEAAVAHWRSAAPAAEQARLLWVVLRHEIDYKQSAKMGDEIVARTWVGTATGLRFERLTEIMRANDRSLLAQARTVWCPIDAATGKPTGVSPDVRARFSAAGDR